MSSCENKSDLIELIERVRQDDQVAFAQLLDRYKPLLDSAIARFSKDGLSRSHEDDLRQEAILVFFNAILNYDLGGDGVEFGLYAKICVTNALISQVRNLSKHKAEHFSVQLDEVETVSAEDPSARIIEQESLQQIDSVIRQSLSAFEYRVWCLYASGKTAKEIGKIVDRSEKSVSNAVYRIRQKLRRSLT